MRDEYIRQGESFEVTLTDTDLTASTATITISDEDGLVLLSQTEEYTTVDDQRVVTITIIDPGLDIGTYSYMYTIEYSDGFTQKLPDVSKCRGKCDLPSFIVCEANDVEGS